MKKMYYNSKGDNQEFSTPIGILNFISGQIEYFEIQPVQISKVFYSNITFTGLGASRLDKAKGKKMDKKEVLQILSKSKQELVSRYGITRLALFGSTVRDEAHSNSDVDIIVAFDGPATSKRYFGVQFYLEDELGCRVDLVTERAVRPELRSFIEKEAVNV